MAKRVGRGGVESEGGRRLREEAGGIDCRAY